MVDQVNALISARRHRADFFRSDLFADPAWDILLDLTRAKLEGRRVSTSSVAAAVPQTTALRWIDMLADEGLLEKLRDPIDARRVFVTLTESATASMKEYLVSGSSHRFAIGGRCKRCGSADFVAPDNAIDESWITCDGCGQDIMTWKAFKTGALEVANAAFTKRLEIEP